MLVEFGRALVWFGKKFRAESSLTSAKSYTMAIESGEASWKFFEFQQILASAEEHYGAANVITLSVKDRQAYFQELRDFLKRNSVEKYLWDPRTLSNGSLLSWMQTVAATFLFARYDVEPIAKLTDVQVRRWRSQTTLITAGQGACLSIMHPERARRWASHSNLVGPVPMPLSRKWLESEKQRADTGSEPCGTKTVRFVGSLYEPRQTFLRRLVDMLAESGVDLEIIGRDLGESRMNSDDYLNYLRESQVAFTTSRPSVLVGQDKIEEGHLVWRFFEAMAMGLPLVAEFVPGSEHLFEPGVHYLSFSNLDEASLAVQRVASNADLAFRMGQAGQKRVYEVCTQNSFWEMTDRAVIRRSKSEVI